MTPSTNRAPLDKDYDQVTIASAGSLSSAIDLGVRSPVAILMPDDWDDADLTFDGSIDGVSFRPLFRDDGGEVTVVAVAGSWVVLQPVMFCSVRYLKVRSGPTDTPVPQSSARTLLLIIKALSV